jgi:hypothetical protein
MDPGRRRNPILRPELLDPRSMGYTKWQSSIDRRFSSLYASESWARFKSRYQRCTQNIVAAMKRVESGETDQATAIAAYSDEVVERVRMKRS